MPGLCTFTLARFERRRAPRLLASVPRERLRLRRTAGLAWGRHLGTSDGSRTLGADLTRWAWFCCWDDDEAAGRFHAGIADRLDPTEAATLTLRTLRTRGAWAGRQLPPPEAETAAAPAPAPARADLAVAPEPDASAGPLVVLTRARVRPRRWRPFTGAVPPIDHDLDAAAGRIRSLGVGEWPILVQGTVSVWEGVPAMTAFARTAAHRTAVRRTAEEGWYGEELFARFAVVSAAGTWDGTPALDGVPASGR